MTHLSKAQLHDQSMTLPPIVLAQRPTLTQPLLGCVLGLMLTPSFAKTATSPTQPHTATLTATDNTQSNRYQQDHLAQCGQQYPSAKPPQFLANKNLDIYYLCFEGFAVGYSAISKTALWSAEHLTRQRIEQASTLDRVNNFHEESRLPNRIKATLNDYKNVPYDRGHLAPNADMATLAQQYDSFSLANIVPQNPQHNRNIWRSVESRTRYLTLKHGDVYVITGTAFVGKNIKKINQNILVPSHLYKVIYIPSLQQAGVYYSPNDDSQRLEVISLNELALRTGVDTMPSLPSHIQNNAMSLPTDDIASPNQKNQHTSEKTPTGIMVIANLILLILEWLVGLLSK
ncbi:MULTISPECIES: DNA/RNA non-specific endonuclease [unclassified Moraxella]|uniref:DNA/RNA non-specific endonuclease n=1 Tax=unclassified Moraxella TaxID=2685852 RepID=UPI003AF45024